ncbi:MAG: tyrosine-type recombinase/integrase [Kiritimatiellaeota bacterium]|nr:tyrosine-type recombinase/integrase [Kiritimatiellota bacterium]
MKTLDAMLDEYLELRRGLGFKLKTVESRLRGFVAFLKNKGASRITTALAAHFASGSETRAGTTKKAYWCAIRGFALYLRGMGFAVEDLPPGLLGRHAVRMRPYIYTDKEVEQLLTLAWNYPLSKACARRYALKPWTLHTLIGLLAATGMRLGEALNLRDDDVDWNEGVVRIKDAKFLKSRLVPVHPTTLDKLRAYRARRERFFAEWGRRAQPCFFVTCRGKALRGRHACLDFHTLLRRAGLREPGAKRGPRLHDLRHRFAVATLLRWYESGKEVGNLMPVLATYLGHSGVSGTYWYLSNTPELMAAAKKCLEARWEGGAR